MFCLYFWWKECSFLGTYIWNNRKSYILRGDKSWNKSGVFIRRDLHIIETLWPLSTCYLFSLPHEEMAYLIGAFKINWSCPTQSPLLSPLLGSFCLPANREVTLFTLWPSCSWSCSKLWAQAHRPWLSRKCPIISHFACDWVCVLQG